MDVWTEIDDERKELLALLEGLDEAQWDTQSLCTEWKVRDVVGHMVGGTELGWGRFLNGMLANGFVPNRFIARDAIERGKAPVAELVEKFRGRIGNRGKPPVVGPMDVLTDCVTHQQDIRRALGIPREVPMDRLVTVADHIRKKQFVIGAKGRIRGLTLRATDTDWTSGTGPEVTGTLEALFMGAIMGRRQPVEDLAGPGVETLTARI